MKKLLVLLVIEFLLSISLYSSQDSDTVWTKDLWEIGDINEIQFMKDGKHIAVAIGAGVSIFDIKTGEQVKRFSFGEIECGSFTFTEDEKTLITTQGTYYIIVWDWDKEDTIKVFRNNTMYQVKYLGNGVIGGIRNLYVWNNDSTKIGFFDFEQGKIVDNIAPVNEYETFSYKPFAKSDNMPLLAISSYNNNLKSYQAEVWDYTTKKRIVAFPTNSKGEITDLAMSSDGKYIASADRYEYINIWDIKANSLIKTLRHTIMGSIYLQIKFSPNSGYLVSSGGGGQDFTTKIWDMNNFDLLYQYLAPYGTSSAIDVSADSIFLCLALGRTLVLLNTHWGETSINNQHDQSKMLFPNPAGTEITLPIEPGFFPKEIKISNYNGQIFRSITQFPSGLNEINIDISNVPSGVYFATVIYQSKSISYKFEKL